MEVYNLWKIVIIVPKKQNVYTLVLEVGEASKCHKETGLNLAFSFPLFLFYFFTWFFSIEGLNEIFLNFLLRESEAFFILVVVSWSKPSYLFGIDLSWMRLIFPWSQILFSSSWKRAPSSCLCQGGELCCRDLQVRSQLRWTLSRLSTLKNWYNHDPLNFCFSH